MSKRKPSGDYCTDIERLAAANDKMLASMKWWDGYVKGIADRNGTNKAIQREYQEWCAALAFAEGGAS